MVTLIGSLRDYLPDDEAGFLEFARSLAQPNLYEAITDAEPATPIAVYKYSAIGVTTTLLRVRNLLKPLSTLFRPRIILAVLRQELAAFRQLLTVTAPASEISAPVDSNCELLHSKV